MQPPILWVAVTRPDNLVNALAIARARPERFTACRLLYENSSWWREMDWAAEAARFDTVHSVEQVPSCRGLRDLPRLHRALADRQRQLAQLCIAPTDTLITLSGITKLGLAVSSAYREVDAVLCTTVQKYADACRPWSWAHYRPTTAGFLQRWAMEPSLGLRRTAHLKAWRGRGDGVRLERPEEPLERIFRTILLLSNDGAELPPGTGPAVRPAPFPSPRDLGEWVSGLDGPPAARPAVVFFGTPFLLVRNLAPDVYRARLNACLRAIRRWYGADCELVYRPHPAETTERASLDLAGFAVAGDSLPAEVFLLRSFHRLRAVFSVSSTASRVALNYGLDAYALWRCFPFDEPAARFFADLMGRVPPGFEVRSLERRPPAYAAGADRPPAFREALQAVLRA